MRSLDAHDLADQLPIGGVDDHHAVGASDVDAMLRRHGYDVVPAAIPAELVRLRDVVTNARLLRDADRHGQRE